MTVVGIDGCRSGWIAVALGDGRVRAHVLRRIDDVIAFVPDAELIAIDIPIGLPEVGHREADVAARRFLGGRRSSVFFTPIRSAVESPVHAEATSTSVRLTGRGVSRQAYALARKILEVERWLPSAPCPVFEVHPEVSFAVLLGAPAAASKKTWAGMVERLGALKAAGIDVEEVRGPATFAASVDDMLDAAVAAWTARRLATGAARAFPAQPDAGSGCRSVAIWA